ncbi:MAG: hypothetical protein DSZ06_00965 [Sulfurospirillum sp.]|nr:MAG: hypothetical protein DSZ06_00965 [Sulfurospirillum sp.]
MKDIFGNSIHIDITNQGLAIKEFKNKIILLNLSGSNICGPCSMAREPLSKIQKKYSNQIRVIEIIAQDISSSELLDLVVNNNIDYPIVSFKNGEDFINAVIKKINKRTDMVPLPSLLVFDSTGNVVNFREGYLEFKTYNELVKKILNK